MGAEGSGEVIQGQAEHLVSNLSTVGNPGAVGVGDGTVPPHEEDRGQPLEQHLWGSEREAQAPEP